MEHTANITEKNNGLISSLLKVFTMFGLILNYKEGKLDVISINCINCKRETGLYLKNTTFDEMITKFVFIYNIASCGCVVDNQLQQRN